MTTSSEQPDASGKITPKRAQARAARAAARKGHQQPRTRKQAAARRREILRETRQSLTQTDVTKLPANERVPELVLVRDLVDARFHPAEIAVYLMVVIFFFGFLPVPAIALAANFAGLALLLLVVVSALLGTRRITRAVRERYPRSTVRVTGYALRRLLAPRRFRRPVPRLRRGDPVR